LTTYTVSLSELRSRIVGASFYPFKPGQITPRRWPFVHSFTYITSGSGHFIIGDTLYEVAPHDLIYIEPGVSHFFHADATDPMVHASIYVDLLSPSTPKQKGDKQLNVHDSSAFDPHLCAARVIFTEDIKFPVHIPIPRSVDWMDSFLSVIELFPEPFTGTDILLRARFESFLIPYIQYTLKPTPAFYDPRIAKLIQWLEEANNPRFHIEEWAQRLGISAAYVYELFRKQTGTSPQAYELKVKLNRAKAYLRETDLPVTEIACRLGFSSLHYFTRQFSKHAQETASHYRKRFRRYG
jgi:AraC-like DNA-binding protein/quercetin dioxygenase-like cupin family protein